MECRFWTNVNQIWLQQLRCFQRPDSQMCMPCTTWTETPELCQARKLPNNPRIPQSQKTKSHNKYPRKMICILLYLQSASKQVCLMTTFKALWVILKLRRVLSVAGFSGRRSFKFYAGRFHALLGMILNKIFPFWFKGPAYINMMRDVVPYAKVGCSPSPNTKVTPFASAPRLQMIMLYKQFIKILAIWSIPSLMLQICWRMIAIHKV